MSTIKTPEQIRAEALANAEKEIARMQADQAVLQMLPVHSDDIGQPNKALGRWIDYKAANFETVAGIVRAFGPMIVETERKRNGCLSMRPAALQEERGTVDGSHVFELSVHQGRGFGPCVVFSFYVQLPDGQYARIRCKLPDSYSCSAQMKPPTYDRYGKSKGDGNSRPNNTLHGLFHGSIAWAANTRGEDAQYTYYLCDDGPHYAETIQILTNTELADWYPKAGI